jgi:fatty-acyl-CoA synthase/long-chain acyl-CoA synthetase
MYTGGTTGRPKGIVHDAGALGTNLLAHVLSGQIRDGEKMLLCTPLPHSAGFFLQAGLLQGATVHLARRFDPADLLRQVEEHAISWTFMVPTMIYRLLDALRDEERDTRSLETIVYGAAPIAKARIEEALRRFGPVFLQLFGQSECPNFATTLSKEDHLDPDLLASCGQPCAGVEVRVGDDEGRAVPTGEIGEVLLRAPYTLREYHAAPELTAQAFVSDWLRTGDVGYQTGTGHLFLVDRKKDMIITGGMNVYSSEVEQVLHEHPMVDAAAVVGVPDSDWGEAVHAFLVGAEGLRADELLQFCRSRLARYKVPKALTRIGELPTTPYGKIDKKVLRAAWLRANTGDEG